MSVLAWSPKLLGAPYLIYGPDSISGSAVSLLFPNYFTKGLGIAPLSQSTSTYQPALIGNSINGHSVIRFDGSDDRLKGPLYFGDISASTVSLFVVSKATGNNLGVVLSTRKNAFTNGWSLRYNSKTELTYFHTGFEPVLKKALTADSWIIAEVVRNENAVSFGVNGVINSYSITGYTASSDELYVGAENSGTNNFFYGDIAEIWAIGKAISVSERQAIEWVLANKFGLTSLLPASYPYLSIGGNVTISGGGSGDSVAIIEATTQEFLALIEPDTNGDWTADIFYGSYYFLFSASGYQSEVSGPHTVSVSGVSPAIPDIVLGSSGGTMKTVGYAF